MHSLEGPYVIEYGDVWNVGVGSDRYQTKHHVADGSEQLGIAYDSASGTLLKHGSAILVEKWLTERMRHLVAAGLGEMAEPFQAIYFPVSKETVDELNACIGSSGRILRIMDRFEEIARQNPEIANRPVYPPR